MEGKKVVEAMPVARRETCDARVIAHVDMDCFYVQGSFFSRISEVNLLFLLCKYYGDDDDDGVVDWCSGTEKTTKFKGLAHCSHTVQFLQRWGSHCC